MKREVEIEKFSKALAMALVMRSVLNFHDYIFVTLKDPRNSHYALIGDSPAPVFSIVIAYALFCKYGPRFMDSKKPVELKLVMSIYNFLQVALNFGASVAVWISVCSQENFIERFFTGSVLLIVEV